MEHYYTAYQDVLYTYDMSRSVQRIHSGLKGQSYQLEEIDRDITNERQ